MAKSGKKTDYSTPPCEVCGRVDKNIIIHWFLSDGKGWCPEHNDWWEGEEKDYVAETIMKEQNFRKSYQMGYDEAMNTVYTDLMAVADAGEIESLRVELNRYFKK